MSDSDVAQLHRDIREAMANVQAIQNPVPLVRLYRRNTTTEELEPVTDADVQLIRIRLGGQDERTTGVNEGAVVNATEGELLGWAGLDVRRNDTFAWQGQAFEVTRDPLVRFGIVRAPVRMIQ